MLNLEFEGTLKDFFDANSYEIFKIHSICYEDRTLVNSAFPGQVPEALLQWNYLAADEVSCESLCSALDIFVFPNEKQEVCDRTEIELAAQTNFEYLPQNYTFLGDFLADPYVNVHKYSLVFVSKGVTIAYGSKVLKFFQRQPSHPFFKTKVLNMMIKRNALIVFLALDPYDKKTVGWSNVINDLYNNEFNTRFYFEYFWGIELKDFIKIIDSFVTKYKLNKPNVFIRSRGFYRNGYDLACKKYMDHKVCRVYGREKNIEIEIS